MKRTLRLCVSYEGFFRIGSDLLFTVVIFCHSAEHVYGDQEMHLEVRRHCMDYMVCSWGSASSVMRACSHAIKVDDINYDLD